MFDTLHEKLNSHLTPKNLLPRVRFIDLSSQDTAAFNDSRYLPFYYHIGCVLTSKKIVEVGFGIGLVASSFLSGCKNTETYLGFQERTSEFYSPRIGRANVREIYKGNLDICVGSIEDFNSKVCSEQWHVGIISEKMDPIKMRGYLESIWKNLSYEGLLIVDYIDMDEAVKQAFCDFCKNKSRSPNLYNTRYGLGLVKR